MPARIPLWHVLQFNDPSYEGVCDKSELLMAVEWLRMVAKGKGDPGHVV